jgi:hypothetical protein
MDLGEEWEISCRREEVAKARSGLGQPVASRGQLSYSGYVISCVQAAEVQGIRGLLQSVLLLRKIRTVLVLKQVHGAMI